MTLFDESFSSLDESSKKVFKKKFIKSHIEKDNSKSTIWVTHNKSELDLHNKKFYKITTEKYYAAKMNLEYIKAIVKKDFILSTKYRLQLIISYLSVLIYIFTISNFSKAVGTEGQMCQSVA